MQQHVLKNLDIEIFEGDFTIIMGSSGAGKSTLLYALSGMDKPTLGSIKFLMRRLQSYPMINWQFLGGLIVDLYFSKCFFWII